MSKLRTSNPIMCRIEKLSNQWLEFATHDTARLLLWRFASDEQRMLDAFFALELEEQTASHSDLFVTFESPFESAESHGGALNQELVAQYEGEKAALTAQGLEAGWTAPEPKEAEPSTELFLRSCVAFAAHHALPRHLVVVLSPRGVRSASAYRTWLQLLARTAPDPVRIVVVDRPASPAPEDLASADRDRIVAVDAGLDMPAAYLEISESAGPRDAPGTRYREAYLKLGAALGSGDVSKALTLGGSAIDLALEQKWFHLAVPVQIALGSALAGDARIDEAEAQYHAAEQNAVRGEAEAAPEVRETCRKLRLHSRLGLGAALMAGERWTAAADVFAQTIPLAAERREDGLRIDCHRLASLCHEQREAQEDAFHAAFDGLEAAKQMPAETLAVSSLPYLGEALVRLCGKAGHESLQPQIERDLEALIGKKAWRPPPPSASEPPAAAEPGASAV